VGRGMEFLMDYQCEKTPPKRMWLMISNLVFFISVFFILVFMISIVLNLTGDVPLIAIFIFISIFLILITVNVLTFFQFNWLAFGFERIRINTDSLVYSRGFHIFSRSRFFLISEIASVDMIRKDYNKNWSGGANSYYGIGKGKLILGMKNNTKKRIGFLFSIDEMDEIVQIIKEKMHS
jgi:hypothetical protein